MSVVESTYKVVSGSFLGANSVLWLFNDYNFRELDYRLMALKSTGLPQLSLHVASADMPEADSA